MAADTHWNSDALPAGVTDSVYISYMAEGIWFLAARAFDEVPNVSGLSNIYEKNIVDTTAPSCVHLLGD
jgi:hypothetical protein